MAVVKLTTIKSFSYRGSVEEWSNTYHLNGTQPADLTAWTAVANAMRDLEKAVLPGTVTLTHWYAYNDGSIHADYSGTFTSGAGQLTVGTAIVCSGDTANMVKFDTGKLNSRGKKIYLRKFFHPGLGTSGSVDATFPTAMTAYGTFASSLVAGTWTTPNLKICRPNGDIAVSGIGHPYVTTRTLKRRGKRPSP